MEYAIVDGRRVEASPGNRGNCPICEGEVLSKCGEINTWHWAHANRLDCDAWSEGESEWHRTWKKRFPSRWREFVIGSHRADIKSPRGIIELQASAISTADIAERERYYNEMVWLVDARDFELNVRDRGSHVTFRWKHPRKTWWAAKKPLFFDIDGWLIEIHQIYHNMPCGGWGKSLNYSEFVEIFSQPKPGTKLCEQCRMPYSIRDLIKTGMYEYYTMDFDPDTEICYNCYETQRDKFIPDDPCLFDCYTPIAIT